MKEPTKTNDYDFATRFLLCACELGAATLFWIIQFASSLGYGGDWPLIDFSGSNFFFLNLLSLHLDTYLLIAAPITPFVIFFHVRTHTVLMLTASAFTFLVVLLVQRFLFPCAILYPILTFFAYRFDRRRSAVLSGLVQS